MTRPITTLVVLFAACGLASFAHAQQSTQPNVQQLTAKITGIEGLVQVRASENDPWQTAKLDMEVGENAEFRTGPKSAVRFVIPPDQTITLDRLGTVKVLQAVLDGGKVKTNLGMKYGRTRYDIEAGGREHEASIASPSSTLAIRGTKVSVFDQRPYRATAVSLTGRAEFSDFRKKFSFGGRNAGKTVVDTSGQSAAARALDRTVVDPNDKSARSRGDQALVASLLSSGATVSFDYLKGIRVVQGGQVPRNDNELIPTLPGTLNFVLRWQGNADVNLGVVSPGQTPPNTTVYPQAPFNLLANQGQTPFDHRGGPNGGIEVAFWPGDFPLGRYFIGAQHISGPNVPATVEVFRDGQRVPINVGSGDVLVAPFVAAPIDPSIASGIGVGTVQFSPSGQKKAATPISGPRPARVSQH